MPLRQALARARCGVALDPDHAPCLAGEGEREIAQATVQVKHAGIAVQFQQRPRRAYQGAIDRSIDLDEVCRQELDLQLRLRQRVVQPRRRRRKRLRAVNAARLQVQMHVVPQLELPQALKIHCRGLRQHAQHQRHGLIGDRDLDLRQLRADRQLRDQRRQRHEQCIERRRQHLAARKVRDPVRAPLAKAHQCPPLLPHVAHAQSRSPPVTPGATGDRGQPALRHHLPDVRQCIGQPLLLQPQLRVAIEPLQGAAAAVVEVGAVRCDLAGGRHHASASQAWRNAM
jgi:hypothetical protein